MKYLVTGFPYVSGPRHKISLLVFPRFPREGDESRRGKTDIPGQHRRLLIMKVLSDQYLHYKVDLKSMLAITMQYRIPILNCSRIEKFIRPNRRI